MQLSKAIDLFLNDQIKTTRKSYLYVLRNMRDHLGPARPVEAVRPEHLVEYIHDVRSRDTVQSVRTINKYVKTIKTFFNWCVKMELITTSPAHAIKRVTEHHQIPRDKSMPDHVLSKVLDYTTTLAELPHGGTARYDALVRFLADTGCRIGGAATLTLDRLDLDECAAIVTEKGKPPRPVVFGKRTQQALRQWLIERKGDQGDYVFQARGKRMTNDSLGQLFSRVVERSGVEGHWGPHSLRHRKGHQLADNRVNPATAATALGHADVSMTLTYYYPRDFARAKDALSELFLEDEENTPIQAKIRPFTDKKKSS